MVTRARSLAKARRRARERIQEAAPVSAVLASVGGQPRRKSTSGGAADRHGNIELLIARCRGIRARCRGSRAARSTRSAPDRLSPDGGVARLSLTRRTGDVHAGAEREPCGRAGCAALAVHEPERAARRQGVVGVRELHAVDQRQPPAATGARGAPARARAPGRLTDRRGSARSRRRPCRSCRPRRHRCRAARHGVGAVGAV